MKECRGGQKHQQRAGTSAKTLKRNQYNFLKDQRCKGEGGGEKQKKLREATTHGRRDSQSRKKSG